MSLETAPTRFVETNGIRFAYRRYGRNEGTPLLFLQHFTGTTDDWDPAVVNALAESRTVIVFDNAGIGRSSGQTPDSVEAMAAHAVAFLGALGLPVVDLLGFSLGGMVAQVLASEYSRLVRRLIIAGAAPRGGEEHLLAVVEDAFSRNAADVRLPLFFTPSEGSQGAGLAFIRRATARTQDRDPESSKAVGEAQARAIIGWCARQDEGERTLRAIRQPALIVHGSDDTMFPSINAYRMFKAMSAAQLILYPDSGHGALFQVPDLFAGHARTFLDL
ncbi:alpha/beta fold hydrolase [Roseomonas elaeocarpi]|uniref:Alpha/beta fold hydrolase n=1 Tax=Roseomonas elaeocarpi TaxID=907779 RepID=A0ABV6JN36_9PROT